MPGVNCVDRLLPQISNRVMDLRSLQGLSPSRGLEYHSLLNPGMSRKEMGFTVLRSRPMSLHSQTSNVLSLQGVCGDVHKVFLLPERGLCFCSKILKVWYIYNTWRIEMKAKLWQEKDWGQCEKWHVPLPNDFFVFCCWPPWQGHDFFH